MGIGIGIEHIIFTPFCSRYYDEWKIGIGKSRADGANTRDTTYIENRLRYLEAVCFSSLVAQRNQKFQWILAIDSDFPEGSSLYSLRRHACAINNKLGGDLESWPVSSTVLGLEDRTGLPLVLNHADTTQSRLAAKKPGRRRVWRAGSFPNVAIDWERIWR